MFKKLVSYLLIFSILISDMVGWGSRPVYGMINDPDEEGSFIPVKSQNSSEDIPLSDESQGSTDLQPTLTDTPQTNAVIKGEKNHQEEAKKNLPVLDLGQGILSVEGEKDGISLSSSQDLSVSLVVSSPREEGEKERPQEDIALTKAFQTLKEDETIEVLKELPTVPEQPSSPSTASLEKFEEKLKLSPRPEEIKELLLEEKKHISLELLVSSEKNKQALISSDEVAGEQQAVSTSLNPLVNSVVEVVIKDQEEAQNLREGEEEAQEGLTHPQEVQKGENEQGSLLETVRQESLQVIVDKIVEALPGLAVTEEVPVKSAESEEKLITEAIIEKKVLVEGSGTEEKSLLREKTEIEKKLGIEDQSSPNAKESMPFPRSSENNVNFEITGSEKDKEYLVFSDALEMAQKQDAQVNTSLSETTANEITPLLSQKNSSPSEDRQPEKQKSGLTQDWLLAGVTSDEEITLKRKSGGSRTDHEEEATFGDDIEVSNIKRGEAILKNSLLQPGKGSLERKSGSKQNEGAAFDQLPQDRVSDSDDESSSGLSLPQSLGGEGGSSYQNQPGAQSFSLMSLKEAFKREKESSRDQDSSRDEDPDRDKGSNLTETTPLNRKDLVSKPRRSFQFEDLEPFSGEPKRRSFPSNTKRSSFPSQELKRGTESESEDVAEHDGFHVLVINDKPQLTPEMEEFLRYVKIRIIDGKLNWKQWLGIGGGIVIGAGCAWPWMIIMFDSLLAVYAYSVDVYYKYDLNNPIPVLPNVLDTQFQNFNSYLNIKIMMGLVGVPMGIAVASRTASILVNLTKDSISKFSVQKSMKHSLALWAVKGGAYCGAFFPGLLPVYYLFHSLLGCDLNDQFQINNDSSYRYYMSTDIYLNFSSNYTCNYCNCTFQALPPENFQLFGIGGAFLFLSTFLWYGYQVSNALEKWVNNSFFVKEEDSSRLTLEASRQKYLAQLKALKKIIYREEVGEIRLLYSSIFLNNLRNREQNVNVDPEESRGFESLRVLKGFQNFYHQPKNGLEEETIDKWKKTWAFRMGCAIPLVATFGRMVIFQYVMAEFLGKFWPNPDHSNDNEYIDWINPSVGATTFSCILGYTLAHLTQGYVEKEAVEECIYELLGDQKPIRGSSHAPLRVGLKLWDYLYSLFQTLPYLVIGFAATTNNLDWPNFYQLNSIPINVSQILFLMTFGIADAFNNAAAFHSSSSININGFDSLISYFYVFDEYKRDKLIRIIHQLRQLFKETTPGILEKIHQILDGNDESDNDQLKKYNKEMNKINFNLSLCGGRSALKTLLRDEKNSRSSFHNLSFETKEFLTYIKNQTLKGTLNWQQKAGIMGGVLTGVAVSWPLMAIIFYGLLAPYFQTFGPVTSLDDPVAFFRNTGTIPFSPAYITKGLTQFNQGVNIYTLIVFVALPLGVDAASRTATILKNTLADKTSSFSIQKTRSHSLLLLGAKSSLYFTVFFASLLPLYYLYDGFFGSFKTSCAGSNLTCSKLEGWFSCPYFLNDTNDCPSGIPNCSDNPIDIYTYTVSTDIFFNITGTTNSPYMCNHTSDAPHKAVFWTGAPFLFFDTFLQYGYQISTAVEGLINDYYFGKIRTTSHLSPLEVMHKKYLAQFKNLKQIIYGLEEDKIDDLYGSIFINKDTNADQNAEVNPEELNVNEALRVLLVFQNFHAQHQKNLEENKEEDWKKNWAFRIGWAIPLIATFGRIAIFQYVLEGILGTLWSTNDSYGNSIPSIGASIVACILGGIFANIAQGWMEKDAVEKGVYDLLRGDKVPDGSSHPHLRRTIKAWDYFYGFFNTIPYLAVGLFAAGYNAYSGIQSWQILLLLSFGTADAFNNAIAFHDSNLNVVNAYDSLVTSYGTPSTEQKKDRLIRMTRQLRRLFKDLRPEVLEEVDFLLNKDRGNVQAEGWQEEGFDEGEKDNQQSDYEKKDKADDRRREQSSDEREEI